MDGHRFDHLTRTMSSRRTAVSGLLGGLAAALGLSEPEKAAAHNPVPACKRIKDLKKRRRCLRRARTHKRRHPKACVAEPAAVTCGRRCGGGFNNCGLAVSCPCPAGMVCYPSGTCGIPCSPPCPAGKACLANGVCATTCSPTDDHCPATCFCPAATVEGGNHCAALGQTCGSSPQGCASTAECPTGFHCQPLGCNPNPNRCVRLCPL